MISEVHLLFENTNSSPTIINLHFHPSPNSHLHLSLHLAILHIRTAQTKTTPSHLLRRLHLLHLWTPPSSSHQANKRSSVFSRTKPTPRATKHQPPQPQTPHQTQNTQQPYPSPSQDGPILHLLPLRKTQPPSLAQPSQKNQPSSSSTPRTQSIFPFKRQPLQQPNLQSHQLPSQIHLHHLLEIKPPRHLHQTLTLANTDPTSSPRAPIFTILHLNPFLHLDRGYLLPKPPSVSPHHRRS